MNNNVTVSHFWLCIRDYILKFSMRAHSLTRTRFAYAWHPTRVFDTCSMWDTTFFDCPPSGITLRHWICPLFVCGQRPIELIIMPFCNQWKFAKCSTEKSSKKILETLIKWYFAAICCINSLNGRSWEIG